MGTTWTDAILFPWFFKGRKMGSRQVQHLRTSPALPNMPLLRHSTCFHSRLFVRKKRKLFPGHLPASPSSFASPPCHTSDHFLQKILKITSEIQNPLKKNNQTSHDCAASSSGILTGFPFGHVGIAFNNDLKKIPKILKFPKSSFILLE
jgi:hypothetical protein